MSNKLLPIIAVGALCGSFATVPLASADPKVSVASKTARPGDPILVTVTGTKSAPEGKALGSQLYFFASRGGYQAVFATPLDAKPEPISIEVDGAKPVLVQMKAVTFPESKVVVEDEMANPPKEDRDRIDADNKVIIEALGASTSQPEFTRLFQRPPGTVTSTFGEWRTFNDGHRSQHLGLDTSAREGSKVKAVNAGTVRLVHDGFLTGNLVVIEHGAGIATAYYHLSKVLVVAGDKVGQGAVIGLAGKTGRTTGPHLHVSVRVPGGFVDPARFFALRFAPKPSPHTDPR